MHSKLNLRPPLPFRLPSQRMSRSQLSAGWRAWHLQGYVVHARSGGHDGGTRSTASSKQSIPVDMNLCLMILAAGNVDQTDKSTSVPFGICGDCESGMKPSGVGLVKKGGTLLVLGVCPAGGASNYSHGATGAPGPRCGVPAPPRALGPAESVISQSP